MLFAVTVVYPILQAVQMSLYDWRIIGSATSEFLGLENYARALGDEHFWLSFGNTVFYLVATIPPQIVIGLSIALLLHARSPIRPLLRVLYYLPVVTSWVVVSLLFRFLFADQGLINWTLGTTVSSAGDTSWLADRWTGIVAISSLGVWKGIGWSMMIFLAALQGVPESLIEAATVDGAGRWQRFRAVTLPAIRSGDGLRHGHARDRRLQRLRLGVPDDRRWPGGRDRRGADLHVPARPSASSSSGTARRSP